MNFARDFVATRPSDDVALVTVSGPEGRREWTFGEVTAAAAKLAGVFVEHGVQRGSVVLTLVGNGCVYAVSMVACLRMGAPMLPCSEQLRSKDIALRLRKARPALIVADARNREAVEGAQPDCPVLWVDSAVLPEPSGDVPDYVDLDADDPSFVLFTSGTSGEPKLVTHGTNYVFGQQLQATEWMAAQPGELVWSTAAPGWSKSARNCFLAPWLGGAAALLQDERFDAARRLETIRAESVDVLCMAPTEYRLIAAAGPIGSLPVRRAVTAGEPLGVAAYEQWLAETGLAISDGYGQTETGQVTGVRPAETAPPGSMGRALPGVDVSIVDGELCLDPATLPTFFLGYDGSPAPAGLWHTGDQVREDEDGWLFFEARADDVILSSGYRIGPVEVEGMLLGHEAVRESAVIGLPDETRGQIVAAAVVLRDGFTPSDSLVAELQEHVRRETAPYKYPRRVWFVDELPKTTSGKIHRSEITPPD